MRKQKMMFLAYSVGATLLSILSNNGYAAEWNGSYAANGQCFCVGNQDASVTGLVVPTPVGGQSVSQVCARIGSGPQLLQTLGTFNYPVYTGPQCGHGPLVTGSISDESCMGTLAPGSDDCVSKGPRWNLFVSYAKPVDQNVVLNETDVAVRSAVQVSRQVTTENLAVEQPKVTGGSRYIMPPVKKERNRDSAFAPTSASGENTFEQQPLAMENQLDKAAGTRKNISNPVVRRAESLQELQARQQVLIAAARERLREKERLRDDVQTENVQIEKVQIEKVQAENVQAENVQAEKVQAEKVQAEKVQAEKAQSPKSIAQQDKQPIVSKTIESVAKTQSSDTGVSVLSALRLPGATRASSREFTYLEVLPVNFDFGGGGIQLEGSLSSHQRWQYVARLGAARNYQEVLVGGSFFLTPVKANRLTVLLTAGLEYGTFELVDTDISTRFSDTGLFLGVSSRFVVNNRIELQAGVGYSAFFDGDTTVFGSAFYHLNRQLDLTSQFEVGDNDSLGIGLRYYYK